MLMGTVQAFSDMFLKLPLCCCLLTNFGRHRQGCDGALEGAREWNANASLAYRRSTRTNNPPGFFAQRENKLSQTRGLFVHEGESRECVLRIK